MNNTNKDNMIPGNDGEVPFRCISFDGKVIASEKFTDLVKAIYLSIHPGHRSLIADWCRREIRHFIVECSDLFGGCDEVHGKIEKQYSQLAIKFPCSLFKLDNDSIHFVIAHEFGHLYQYALGIHRRIIDNERALSYFEGDRQVYLDGDNHVWGNGKEFENDADRLAGAWGFPRPIGNWDREIIATGEVKIHCYFSSSAFGQKQVDIFDSLMSFCPSLGICFEIEPVDLDAVEFEEREYNMPDS